MQCLESQQQYPEINSKTQAANQAKLIRGRYDYAYVIWLRIWQLHFELAETTQSRFTIICLWIRFPC